VRQFFRSFFWIWNGAHIFSLKRPFSLQNVRFVLLLWLTPTFRFARGGKAQQCSLSVVLGMMNKSIIFQLIFSDYVFKCKGEEAFNDLWENWKENLIIYWPLKKIVYSFPSRLNLFRFIFHSNAVKRGRKSSKKRLTAKNEMFSSANN
jgi:hypothetical protein